MSITFELPNDLEKKLRTRLANVDAEAKESFLVDLYRRGELTPLALAEALALDRFETDAVLHKHKVTEDLGSIQDYLDDVKTLEKLRTPR